jgi:hypothetical protein
MDADLQQLIDRQEIAGTPGGDTSIIAGSYTDTLARISGGWKIAERVQVYQWRDGNRAVVSR